MRESRYLAINETGKALWALLSDGATHEELVDRLVDTFGVDQSRASADVDAFTTELESRGLLNREDDAAPPS